MTRQLRPADESTAHKVQLAMWHLLHARYFLAMADCPRALTKVRRALMSAEGAYRHAVRRAKTREAECSTTN